MRFLSQNALTASTLLLAASSATANAFEELDPRSGMVYVACYSSSESFGSQIHFPFQSTGWCYDKCSGSGFKAFALTQGSQCQCGNTLPPDSAKVPDSKCNTPCDGWPSAMCGGSGFWSIYTTGMGSVSPVSASTTTAGGGNDTTAATKTDQTATSVSTNSGGQTVVVTETSHNNGNSNGNANSTPASSQTPSNSMSNAGINAKSKSSHNTAAIAAGIVVGVVGLAALAGGVFFFIRSKKQKAERGAGYSHDSQPPSMSDSRFDGSYMAQRRQSNGSIDDDHDFSRRILQVTNPDR